MLDITVLRSSIAFPALALVAYTLLVVGPYLLYTRVLALRSKEVKMSHFRLMETKLPEVAQKASRHFVNMFEVPTLFYANTAIILATGVDSPFLATIGWIFFICRVIHSAIHLTYNNVNHRFVAFLVGVVLQTVLVFNVFMALYDAKVKGI